MQSMLDICSIEIAKLHLKCNIKKSLTLRICTRYNVDCAPLILDGNVLSFVAMVRYLGSLSLLRVAGHF